MTITVREVMQTSPVIPVMVIDDINDAVPMAQALVSGGLRVLEITLRTEVALEAIKIIKAEVPEALVGAGTILNPAHLEQALLAGSEFIVTPGTTVNLLDAAADIAVPFLPGVSTGSDVMRLLERGFEAMKFFPAQAAGGTAMLKSFAGPFGQVQFCPTGGINLSNAKSYLALNNVACVGGSWMLPAAAIKQKDWASVRQLAAEASALGSSAS